MSSTKTSPFGMNTTVFRNKALFYKQFKKGILNSICVSMPCQIVSYDRATHIAVVRPMLNYTVKSCTDSECSNMKIEILRLMAGGFLIDFPISEGDTGWIIAVDRDCYQVKESSKPALPSGSQVNSYKTGFWIPDQWGNENKLGISGVDANRLVIQSKDGTQKISVGASDIEIKATQLNINVGKMIVKADEYTNFETGDVRIFNNLGVKAGLISNWSTGNDVVLNTHVHITGQTGQNTGTPKN